MIWIYIIAGTLALIIFTVALVGAFLGAFTDMFASQEPAMVNLTMAGRVRVFFEVLIGLAFVLCIFYPLTWAVTVLFAIAFFIVTTIGRIRKC